MANTVLPMLIPLMLGGTIDVTNYSMEGSVYQDSAYEETKMAIANYTFSVLQDGNDVPYADIGYPPDIVMRIKAGMLSSQIGYHLDIDQLFNRKYWYSDISAIVSVTSKIFTSKRSLREGAGPISDWQTNVPETQTHYVKSVTYGGLRYAFYEFVCSTPEDAAIFRNLLTSMIGEHGELTPNTIDQWEEALNKLEEHPEMRGKWFMNTYVYTTGNLIWVFPYSFGGMRKLLTLPAEVVDAKEDPVFVELAPLHDLDSKYPEVTENHDSDAELSKTNVMFDDVSKTYRKINRWKSSTNVSFTEEDENKVSSVLDDLRVCIDKFKEVTVKTSVFKEVDHNLLQSAASLYESKLEKHLGTYYSMYRELRQQFDPGCENAFRHKIKGHLEVEEDERQVMIKENVNDCKQACFSDNKCVAIGYEADNKCTIYYRSSITRKVTGPLDAAVYDRDCEFSDIGW